MPFTSFMILYASSHVFATYFGTGLLVGIAASLGGVYWSQPGKTSESELRSALNDLIKSLQDPTMQVVDFEKKLLAYQHLFDDQTQAFFKNDFRMRHEEKSFHPSHDSVFKKIPVQYVHHIGNTC